MRFSLFAAPVQPQKPREPKKSEQRCASAAPDAPAPRDRESASALSLVDVAFIVALAGYRPEVLHCLQLCKALYTHNRLLQALVPVKFGRDGRTLLTAAAKAGNETRVLQLLDCGASAFATNALEAACSHRHEHVARILIEDGATLGVQAGRRGALHIACENGLASTVLLMLGRGAEINLVDCTSQTPLHVASAKGQASTVRLLIERGADLSARASNNCTALHLACIKGDLPTVCLLLDCGQDLNARSEHNETPLHFACDRGNAAVAHWLIEKGADVNAADDKTRESPLLYAVTQQLETVVRALLERGASPRIRSPDGMTLLHAACERGNASIARMLIAKGAYINAAGGEKRRSPLFMTLASSSEECFDLLLANGADVRICNVDESTLLHIAVCNCNERFVRLILRRDPGQVHIRNRHKQTPLHFVGSSASIARLLIDKGAKLNVRDNLQQTPLLIACGLGHMAVASVLLDAGAETEGSAASGMTPLYAAVSHRHASIVRMLIEKGANVNLSDVGTSKATPLHAACDNGDESTARLLLENGASVNAKNTDGTTPLHVACFQGHEAVARLLLEHGANINARDAGNCTPLLVAVKKGHKSVARLLAEAARAASSSGAGKPTGGARSGQY